VLLLINHFLKEFNSNLGKAIKGFDKDAIQYLLHYDYPGNVRELRNIVEHAVHICQDECIGIEHLPSYILSAATTASDDHSHYFSGAPELPPTIERESGAVGAASSGNLLSWTAIEKSRILEALANSGGNRSEAAERLGWSRSTLWRKIKHHGLY